MTLSPLRSFRLVCKREEVPMVESLLAAQGFRFEEEPFFSHARRLVHEPFPLGASLAAFFGYIYIQDRSSMLPPLALAPSIGAHVLDMCASPGSKTGLLGQLVGPSGFVLGNEPSRNRLATLRRNMQSLNLVQCATMSFPGETLPLPSAGQLFCGRSVAGNHDDRGEFTPLGGGTFDSTGFAPKLHGGWRYIQLDPPCSGWGTVEKNPQVMKLWQGEKLAVLIGLQRRLLREAARLLLPGGRMIYSTCTTNIGENEDQVRFAVEELGLDFIPLPPLPGFTFEDAADPAFNGCLRVATGEDGQGFFVAALEKKQAVLSGEDLSQPFEPVRSRKDGEKKGRPVKKDSVPPRFLPPIALNGMCVDPLLLPEGDIADFNGIAHFLPAGSRTAMPDGVAWKGFPLGKAGDGGVVRVSPGLRVVMPKLEDIVRQRQPHIVVEDVTELVRLLSGQNLEATPGVNEVGLYFGNLPLCRLAVKGKRAVLPPLF